MVYIEEQLAVRLPNHDILSTPILIDAAKFYTHQGKELKNKMDQIAAEVSQRQKKLKFLQEIIQEINNSIGNQNGIDVSNNDELKEKLLVAKNLGVNIPLSSKSTDEEVIVKTSYSSEERKALLENLHLSFDAWDKDNKQDTEKLKILSQESDRYLMLVSQVLKYEDKPKRTCINGIKGG